MLCIWLNPMRRLLATTVLITAFLAAPVLAAPMVGQPAPDFTAQAADGATVKLADLKGKTVVLEWTNDSCPFVKKHYGSGNMQALQKDAAAKGIIWLSIISSAPGKQGHVDAAGAQKLTIDRGAAPTHVLLDPTGSLGRLYDAKTTPHMFVVDKAGVLAYAGAIDDKASTDQADIVGAKNFVMAALGDLAAKRTVAHPRTAPYGCSIKY